jgi:HK97 gp10 family phage protein
LSIEWVIGGREVSAKLGKIEPNVREALRKEVQRLSLSLVARIQKEYLSGQVLNVRTGTLRRSINAQQFDGTNNVSAQVGANLAKAKYAKAWEFGFDRKVGAGARGGPRTLIGKARDRYIMKHPSGVKHYAARPFVRPAFDAMKPQIIIGIETAGKKAIKDTMK